MELIAEEVKASESKTARLKALRLQRDEAAAAAIAPKSAPIKAKRRKSA